MGVLADTIEEVNKLPPAGKIAVIGGGAGLLLWLYLSHRGAGVGATASGVASGVGTGVGDSIGVVSGAPTTGAASTGTTATGGTTTTSTTTSTTTTPKPVISSTQPAGQTGPQLYTVKSGDYLSAIASRYHVAGGWQAIYNRNRGVIGGNPNLIRPGQVLKLY